MLRRQLVGVWLAGWPRPAQHCAHRAPQLYLNTYRKCADCWGFPESMLVAVWHRLSISLCIAKAAAQMFRRDSNAALALTPQSRYTGEPPVVDCAFFKA
eukprot:957852-Pelagomonas_calceolata.AAC.1